MIGVRRHDRYVLRAFWSAFGAVLVFFTVIVIVIHMSDRLARLVRHWQPLRDLGYRPLAILAEYYATLVPFLWMQIVPLAAVLAAAFALTRLTRHNELAPVVTAGVSTRRLTLPILVAGAAIGGALFLMQETIAPRLNRRNLALERLINESDPGRDTEVPHFDDPGGARLSVAAFDTNDLRLEGAILVFRSPEGRIDEVRAYPALKWDPAGRWIAEGEGTRYVLPPGGGDPQRVRIPVTEPVPLETDLDLFEVNTLKDAALGLSTHETGELVRADPDNPRIVMLHNQLFARAFVPLVLLLFGLPFCLGLGRRSAIPGTIAVLATGAVYYATSFLAESLAASGSLNAVFLAWFPVVAFGSVGLGLWATMDS